MSLHHRVTEYLSSQMRSPAKLPTHDRQPLAAAPSERSLICFFSHPPLLCSFAGALRSPRESRRMSVKDESPHRWRHCVCVCVGGVTAQRWRTEPKKTLRFLCEKRKGCLWRYKEDWCPWWPVCENMPATPRHLPSGHLPPPPPHLTHFTPPWPPQAPHLWHLC